MIKPVVSFGALGVSFRDNDENARKNFEVYTKNLGDRVEIVKKEPKGIFEEYIIKGLRPEDEKFLNTSFNCLGLNSQLDVKA